jgi:hypothetical protein
MSRARSKLLALVVTAILCAGMTAAGAAAAPVTIGPQAQKGEATLSFGAPATVFNASLAAPASVTSPVSGLIIRWRVVVSGTGTGPLTLRVLQTGPGNKVTGIASGPSQEMSAGTATLVGGKTIYTLPANLPIAAGQTIGIDGKPGSPTVALLSPAPAGSLGLSGFVADGETQAWSPFPGFEMLVNADVQPPPTMGALSPASGATTAGFPVVIAGTDFTGVKAVEFGGVPAQRFIPGTEGELTAFPPPVSAPGSVPVTVTTIAGKSTNAGTYTYTACVVPKLTKKKLKADRKALAAAGCTLGNVKRKRHAGKKAKVTKQSVKAGTVLPVGSSVGVTVG